MTIYQPPSAPVSPLVAEVLDNAHSQLGTNPFGQLLICLQYVRTWSGLPRRLFYGQTASAELARQYYASNGVLHTGGNPLDAPLGAWLFYKWGSYGHVGIRCEHGLIHQNNFTGGNGIISHDADGQLPIPYLGYVTLEDAINDW